ncbi:hypothetical protein [Persephonella sp.]
MIVLGDPRWSSFNRFQQGLLNTLGMYAQQQWKNDLLQKQYQMQIEKAKELAQFQADLEEQKKQKTLERLLGTPQAEMQNIDDAFNPGDIRQDIIQGMQNAKNQGMFGSPEGLLLGAIKNMPSLNLPEPQVSIKYKGGILSDYANQNPLIADMIKVQVYGVQLPKVKKEKQEFIMGKPIKTVDKNGNPVWKVPKLNKETGEITYEVLPVAKEIQKGKITVSESKPFVGEDGKPYFVREYIYPDGRIKREVKRYYENSTGKSSGKNQNKITVSPNQLLRGLDKFTKKITVSLTGEPVEIPRNATYADVKKVFSGKDVYIRSKSGKEYKVVGVIDNKPLIDVNGESFRLIGEKNGEPVVEININGRTIAAPVSKIDKLKRKYSLESSIKFSYNPTVGYKTADEYLKKYGVK